MWDLTEYMETKFVLYFTGNNRDSDIPKELANLKNLSNLLVCQQAHWRNPQDPKFFFEQLQDPKLHSKLSSLRFTYAAVSSTVVLLT